MGMAASQARLLSITSRMADNELRAQIVNNSKMRLATESSQASEDYVNALNDATMMFTNYDVAGNDQYQKLNFNNLTQYSSYNTQYGLTNAYGQLMISENEARLYKAANGDLDKYLELHGLEKDTSYFTAATFGAESFNLEYYDEESMLTYNIGNYSVGELKNMYYGIGGYNGYANNTGIYEEYLATSEALQKSYNKVVKTDPSFDLLTVKIKNMVGEGGTLAAASYADALRALRNAGDVGNFKFNASLMSSKISAAGFQNDYSYYDSYVGKRNNASGPSFTVGGVSYGMYDGIYWSGIDLSTAVVSGDDVTFADGKVEDASNYFYIDKNFTLSGRTNQYTYSYDSSSGKYTINCAGGKTITAYSNPGNSNFYKYGPEGEVDDFLYVNNGVFQNNDKRAQFTIYYDNTYGNNILGRPNGYTSSTDASRNYVWDDIKLHLPLARYHGNEQKLYMAELGDANGNGLMDSIKDATSIAKEALVQFAAGALLDCYTYQFPTSSPVYATMLNFNDKFFDGVNPGLLELNCLNNLPYMLQCNSDNTTTNDISALNSNANLKAAKENFIIDCLFDKFGEPTEGWLIKDNIEEDANPKVQWYTNMFNKIEKCGYAVLEDGLASSNEWIQYALESGLVNIEQVDKQNAWNATLHSNVATITEVTDDVAVARAEAKYKKTMNDIENKDKRLDIELKNIDTEHNALQTEYESVKNVISKNIERSFKMYSA